MNSTILYAPISNTTLPPLPQKEHHDGGDKTLTVLYIDGHLKYHVDCKSSACKTRYMFNGDDLGIAVFDKETEAYLGSSKPINKKYFLFLKRSVQIWKKHFSHI